MASTPTTSSCTMSRLEDDDKLVEKADEELNVTPLPKALRATNELSTVFSGTPAKGTVHILVKAPDTGK